MSPSPAAVASVALVAFWLIEIFLRRGESAKSWQTSSTDSGSTFAIILAYIFVAVGLTQQLQGPRLSISLRWLGALVAVAGAALRVVAFVTLGSSYSRTLRVTQGQALITHGLYRFVRHPGYCSAIFIWCGAAAASGSLYALAFAALVLIAAYGYRIRAEERMLVQSFGDKYTQYQAQSWRLLPYVYEAASGLTPRSSRPATAGGSAP